MIRTPCCFSKASISERGIAAPPDVPIRSDDRSISRWVPTCRIPAQIVGTAEARVERSASMKSTRAAGVMYLPGMCSVIPAMKAANGMPQAFTWNMGTIVSCRSASPAPVAALVSVAMACRNVERCE
jgi:hypothetical protein